MPTQKIKGGAWTVTKFFVLSIGFTSVWLAVSSELGKLREQYGPAVLLWLNLAYYAPSLPLLITSSLTDGVLEERLGPSRLCLVRLVFGMSGYGVLCAWFPWAPIHPISLITLVLGLGAFSGIAFAASYQLVSGFANKNVIALGLGCIASGPVVLVIQVALGLHGKQPVTHGRYVLFYSIVTGIVALGLWAGVSLLWRHWNAIESNYRAREEPMDVREVLLNGESGADLDSTAEFGGDSLPLRRSGSTSLRRSSLMRQPSLPALVSYGWLEPGGTNIVEDWDEMMTPRRRLVTADAAERSQHGEECAEEQPIQRHLSYNSLWRTSTASEVIPETSIDMRAGLSEEPKAGLSEEPKAASPLLDAVRYAWPALLAIGIQSGVALTIFPFFTFVPSSGLLGPSLATVLFWVRIFADILGRVLPRASAFLPSSPGVLLIVAFAKLAAEPLFFFYIKSPPRWHADALVIVYVILIWLSSGWLNSAANMMAPKLVPPRLKSAVAGLMALTYQVGHILALAVAVLLTLVLYGSIGVGS
jgi:hypothetical protein